jgi:hypothetical protein
MCTVNLRKNQKESRPNFMGRQTISILASYIINLDIQN